MTEQQKDKINDLLTHLAEVRQTAARLGMKLIDAGEVDLGRILMANACVHDHSKFFGVEWDVIVLNNRSNLLATAVEQHNHS